MDVTVEVDDTKAMIRFETMGRRVHDALLTAVTAQSLMLEGYVKSSKLSGQVLNRVTGNLRASIHSEVQDDGDRIVGRVYSGSEVKYGAIHEYGGTINVPDIFPVRAQALHFFAGGKEIFAKHVRAHKVTMPERSFMRSSLSDKRDEIVAAMTEAVTKAAGET